MLLQVTNLLNRISYNSYKKTTKNELILDISKLAWNLLLIFTLTNILGQSVNVKVSKAVSRGTAEDGQVLNPHRYGAQRIGGA